MAAPAESKEEVVFNIRGPRGALTAEHARSLCETMDASKVTKAILSTWAFAKDSAEVIAEALKRCSGLTALDASDIIAGREEKIGVSVYEVLTEALHEFPLRALDLSNNAVGPKGLVALERLLTIKNLEDVRFCNCGISAEAMETIRDLLTKSTPTKLRHLHFHNNMSGEGGALALADLIRASPDLRSIRFSSSRGSAAGGVALAEALQGLTSLEHVQFDDNMFKPDIAEPLAKALAAQKNLTFLSLADIELGDDGIKTLVETLVAANPGIKTLNINGTEVTEDGAKFVGRALIKLPSLMSMNAEDNEFGTKGALSIAKRLARRKRDGDALCSLNFSGNQILTRGALALAEAAKRESLVSFTIDGNEVSEDGVAKLEALLGDSLGSMELNTPDDDDNGSDVSESEGSSGDEEDAPAPAADGAAAALADAMGGMSL